MVVKAAAENLVPCVIDLGGKNPAIVDQTSNPNFAAKKILFGKLSNLGQMSISPDYVLCHESKVKEFVAALKNVLPIFNENPGKIINSENYNRLCDLFDPQNLGPDHEICIGNPNTF